MSTLNQRNHNHLLHFKNPFSSSLTWPLRGPAAFNETVPRMHNLSRTTRSTFALLKGNETIPSNGKLSTQKPRNPEHHQKMPKFTNLSKNHFSSLIKLFSRLSQFQIRRSTTSARRACRSSRRSRRRPRPDASRRCATVWPLDGARSSGSDPPPRLQPRHDERPRGGDQC